MRSECQHSASGEDSSWPADGLLLAVSSHGREKVLVSSSFTWTLVPLRGPTFMTSSKPNYLPVAPSPNTIMMGARVSTYQFGGDEVQLIAPTWHMPSPCSAKAC